MEKEKEAIAGLNKCIELNREFRDAYRHKGEVKPALKSDIGSRLDLERYNHLRG